MSEVVEGCQTSDPRWNGAGRLELAGWNWPAGGRGDCHLWPVGCSAPVGTGLEYPPKAPSWQSPLPGLANPRESALRPDRAREQTRCFLIGSGPGSRISWFYSKNCHGCRLTPTPRDLLQPGPCRSTVPFDSWFWPPPSRWWHSFVLASPAPPAAACPTRMPTRPRCKRSRQPCDKKASNASRPLPGRQRPSGYPPHRRSRRWPASRSCCPTPAWWPRCCSAMAAPALPWAPALAAHRSRQEKCWRSAWKRRSIATSCSRLMQWPGGTRGGAGQRPPY